MRKGAQCQNSLPWANVPNSVTSPTLIKQEASQDIQPHPDLLPFLFCLSPFGGSPSASHPTTERTQ